MSKYNQKSSKELLESIIPNCLSIAAVVKALGLKQAGGTQSHIKNRIAKYGIDTSHFLGVRVNSGTRHKGGYVKLSWEQILVYNRLDGRKEKIKVLKRALIESGVEEKCSCGLGKIWNGKPLVLQIDHIDGDFFKQS